MGTRIYPRATIWAPLNLDCGRVVAIADGANIYNTSLVVLEDLAIVSQDAYVCCGSHDFTSLAFDFISRPIVIEREAWIAARDILLPGVTIGRGAVVGAGSVVRNDVPAWTVYAGNPAVEIKKYDRR